MKQSLTQLRVYLFGHFSAERGGHVIAGLEPRRLQELFSYLLLNRHRRCSRELLASLFWGESSTEQAKRNLRQVLWQLQTALEAEISTDTASILTITADWLQINPNADLWLDVDCFEQAWNKTRYISGKDLDASQAQLLRNAIGLHQEVLLLGNYESWCLCERERLRECSVEMLNKLMEYSEFHHDYEAALRAGSRILDYDRAHEATYQHIMRLYYFLGQRVEALKQYQRCKAALLEELGALPSRSTRTLYQHIFLEQLEVEMDGKGMTEYAQQETPLLAHILHELQQVQAIQTNAQRQVDFHIRKIEQALQTFVGASKEPRTSKLTL